MALQCNDPARREAIEKIAVELEQLGAKLVQSLKRYLGIDFFNSSA
jgi:hypothetical protein